MKLAPVIGRPSSGLAGQQQIEILALAQWLAADWKVLLWVTNWRPCAQR
jgi:hypothetical protein